ncbi:hypothetical protein GCM10018966_047070 [Streptomyces yanii]
MARSASVDPAAWHEEEVGEQVDAELMRSERGRPVRSCPQRRGAGEQGHGFIPVRGWRKHPVCKGRWQVGCPT